MKRGFWMNRLNQVVARASLYMSRWRSSSSSCGQDPPTSEAWRQIVKHDSPIQFLMWRHSFNAQARFCKTLHEIAIGHRFLCYFIGHVFMWRPFYIITCFIHFCITINNHPSLWTPIYPEGSRANSLHIMHNVNHKRFIQTSWITRAEWKWPMRTSEWNSLN